ncbi:alpha/beta hydrolase [Mycolicibacterium neoaurum]|uniref:alpha/beta hydrolase n=1 Tax=Mycolicibacterium neoaurum TaxID=1795 RepID=UPI00248C435A|nr:alpha/beta hydrolase [Mycolicibacterium neoaurum]WBP93216.1 alpha/beta hydrolase [Mycolicibacterium neoaurum]WBS06817.1 alpha/beta hydrolase [Mycolicibacterium neoaurum]
MTVSVEDIDRWDAGDVREVFNATRSRAEAAFEASNGIAELPAFGTWGGEASEAAKESVGQTRKDLDAHGNEALAVAQAASKAADEIDAVKASLAQLRADAASHGFEVDPIGNQILPGPALQANMIEMLAAESTREALQARLAGILADAAGVDQELARAIAMATGASPIPESPAIDPVVQDILSKPLPEDIQQFHDMWESLTDEQKDQLYAQNHFVGNHPGMPFEDRDQYNRTHLGELSSAAQAEVDRIAAEHPEWASGPPTTANPNPPKAYREWRQRLDDAAGVNQKYEQVEKALESPDGLPRYLGILDDQGHAAVSINNPDEAIRHATFVPGTGQDLSRLEFSTEKSRAMYEATMNADRSLRPGDVSVTTWMDYDRPMKLWEAASPSYAHNGADALQDFQSGLRVTHEGAAGPSTNTVIGHSYGSTLMGAAGLDGYLDANNVVAVGSPGVLAGTASDLNLPDGAHVFATRAEKDIITLATGMTLGPDPTSGKFGAIPFEAAPGKAWPFGLPSVDAHSSYWDNANNPALINFGRIIAGRTDVTPP